MEFIACISSEKGLLGTGKGHLCLIHQIEGLGYIIADAVRFELEAGTFAKSLQSSLRMKIPAVCQVWKVSFANS